ncbi:MAG: hypothetical protein CMJ83_17590 [Planctomycetes bacterium]|nr:hypothetical protein [Planctomycetota bacterium]
MNIVRLLALTLATAGCTVLLVAPGVAQDGQARFAAPKRIQAGDAFMGEGRLYPSPALHDVNGDGQQDIVVGDLFGRVTVAQGSKSAATFGPDKPLNDRDGKPLKFHNW